MTLKDKITSSIASHRSQHSYGSDGTGSSYTPMTDASRGRAGGSHTSAAPAQPYTTGGGSSRGFGQSPPSDGSSGFENAGASTNAAGAAQPSSYDTRSGGTYSSQTQPGSAGGTGRFDAGYIEDAPGYSEKFRAGQPQYRENVARGEDGSYNASISASGGKAEWQKAVEYTQKAEHEAASANLAGNRAAKELSAAEQAEVAVSRAQAKHREALLEAEKYRDRIEDPSPKEAAVSDARDLYREKQSALAAAERALREAEAERLARRREAQQNRSQVESFASKLPGLEDRYEQSSRDRENAEEALSKLQARAEGVEADRARYLAELEGAQAELEQRQEWARTKEQEYVEARDAARDWAAQAAAVRNKLREVDGVLASHNRHLRTLDDSLPAYRAAEERALRELEDSKAEWYRLRELEDEYSRALQSAQNNLQGLQGSVDPASREARDARGLLSARQEDLDRARQRSRAAEAKYRELLNLADRHKHYGDSAADTAALHGDKYEANKREAHMHGDKHVEYWNEAKDHGELGSSEATSAIKKLEEKVKGLMHNEP